MIDDTRFTTTEVMKAAGVDYTQLANWLKSSEKNSLGGNIIITAGVKGKEREFSVFALMTIIVAKVLTDLGMSPKRAFALAARVGQTDDFTSGDVARNIGLPCHHSHGETYLVTNGSQTAVVLRGENEGIDSAIRNAGFLGEHTSPGLVTVNVSMLFENAMIAIGFDPEAILNAAYPKVAS